MSLAFQLSALWQMSPAAFPASQSSGRRRRPRHLDPIRSLAVRRTSACSQPRDCLTGIMVNPFSHYPGNIRAGLFVLLGIRTVGDTAAQAPQQSFSFRPPIGKSHSRRKRPPSPVHRDSRRTGEFASVTTQYDSDTPKTGPTDHLFGASHHPARGRGYPAYRTWAAFTRSWG